MKHCYSEEQIALYVENDLDPRACLELEAHLQQCADCGGLAKELRQSQAILKSLREESVAPAALSEVRQRVLSGIESTWMTRIERLLFGGLRGRYAIAGVALVTILSGSLWYSRQSSEVPAPAIAVVDDGSDMNPSPLPAAPPPQEIQTPAKPPVVKTTSIRALRPRVTPPPETQPEAEPKQVMVKLLTDDPNIVIYWLLEQNGGEQ
jgi:anti-sigma factor RsiW